MIFGIGLNKTGTTSLAEALNILGFSCLHNMVRVREAIDAERERGLPLLSTFDGEYQAFCDFPIYAVWQELDEMYPGSKFIWTDRELDPWLESRIRHVEYNRRMNEQGRGNVWTKWATVDVKQWTQEYFDHQESIIQHFKSRNDDLLRMQICDGHEDGWQPLCQFLGVAEPEIPFPKRNVGNQIYVI